MDLKIVRETPPWDWPEGTGKRFADILRDREAEGFEREIVAALEGQNPDVRYEAVCAAGVWSVGAAWPHVAALVSAEKVDKPLRLAAIDAVTSIRPEDAAETLGDLLDSTDEDIVEAVHEALATAEGVPDDDEEDDERQG
jgi:HEAT repeat protein